MQKKGRKIENMGDNGKKPIVTGKSTTWFEHHPSRPSAAAVPVLTIIFWALEDGTVSKAVGWLKKAMADEVKRQELNQIINEHVDNMLADMIRLGLIGAEKTKLALEEGGCGESDTQLG